MQGILVLGIDPGTAATGYGLVQKEGEKLHLLHHGVISTSSHDPLPQRLHVIHSQIVDLIDRFQPHVLAVERLYFSANVQSALAVGQAGGVVLLAAAQAGIPIYEYRPQEVKESVVGYGRASKAQVQELVRMLLNLDFVPQPDDAADAIAVALCHLHHTVQEER